MTDVVDISLVLTVLNEENSIQSFLDSLRLQTVLPREVVITDGGSTDSTKEKLGAWIAPLGVSKVILSLPGANISAGRNHSIQKASSSFIAITDAGTILDKEWLESLYATLVGGADVAAGFFRPGGNGRFEKILGSVITPHVTEIMQEKFLPSSRSVALRKGCWSEAGGYPEWLDYCEDLIFDMELKKLGADFVFVPHAVATWNARSSLRAFYKQYYRYARGDGKAGIFFKRHLVRYFVYIGATVLLISTRASKPGVFVIFLGFFIYMAKYWRRVFHFKEVLGSSHPAALALAPVVVVVGDVAKMTGFPVGLVWRRKRNKDA